MKNTESEKALILPTLPPETLLKIFSHVDSARPGEPVTLVTMPCDRPLAGYRNTTLFQCALVSNEWAELVRYELYGHLEVHWRASVGMRLLASFDANPILFGRVLHLRAKCITSDTCLSEWEDSEAGRGFLRRVDGSSSSAGGNAGRDRTSQSTDQTRLLVPMQASIGRVISGDAAWINSDGGRSKALELFWAWVAKLHNLKGIDSCSFQAPLSPTTQLALQPVASALTNVSCCSRNSDVWVGILQNVRVLRFTLPISINPEYLPPTPHALLNLTHLEVNCTSSSEHAQVYDVFRHLCPSNLVAINLCSPCLSALESLIFALPFMSSLKSLIIDPSLDDNVPSVFTPKISPTFFTALFRTPLEHLTYPLWSTLQLLSSLPPTLKSILLHADSDAHGDFPEIHRWKSQHGLESLEVVAVKFDMSWGDGRRQMTEENFEGGVKLGEGFEIRKFTSYYEHLPGRWVI
ncbi:hypothetical protein P7C70_g6024, partial [Phenoliferia sp. Uapishka_3]